MKNTVRNYLQYTLLITAVSIAITGCANNTEHQKLQGGPSNSEALGFIVSNFSDAQKEELLTRNPQASYRLLSPKLGIYEFKGVSQQDIFEVSSKAIIEKNNFYKIEKSSLSQNTFSNHLKLKNSKPSDFFDGLIENSLLSLPKVELISIDQKNIKYLQPNDTVELKIKNLNDSTSSVAWYLMPPLGSELETQLIESENLKITFDMAATYNVALLYKRARFFNYEIFSLNPTLNEPLKKLSNKTHEYKDGYFYHLDIISQKSALKSLAPIKPVTVAVCDTGVNYNHPSLNDQIWINSDEVLDGTDTDGNGYVDDVYGYDFFYGDNMPMDDEGHGTHVAGLIAGRGMGAATDVAKIMALKVGTGERVDHGSLIECVSYAIDKKAKIINISIGGEGESKILKFVLQKAQENGVLVVTAAGNGDENGIGISIDERPMYPASYDLENIISVGACDERGELTPYSNFGIKSVDIVAPGGYSDLNNPESKKLLSAYLNNPSKIKLQGLEGTSMAAPIVAGSVALYLSENPYKDFYELSETITTTGNYVSGLSDSIRSSSVVNVEQALTSSRLMF